MHDVCTEEVKARGLKDVQLFTIDQLFHAPWLVCLERGYSPIMQHLNYRVINKYIILATCLTHSASAFSAMMQPSWPWHRISEVMMQL